MVRCEAPAVEILDDLLRVHFTDFSARNYPLFLRVKSLPEYELDFQPADDSYLISAPARFASMLGVQAPRSVGSPLDYPAVLFDDQVAILDIALASKRFAYWGDCGLGKTLVQLEWGRQVHHMTGGRVLHFTLNEIVSQTIDEAQRFYGDSLPIRRLNTREEMKDWCRHGPEPYAITNYEKMNHGPQDQVVNEMRFLAGVSVDESDRLSTGGGKQKWALIKSCKGIEFKLSLTATPAPNDTTEFASQASFLEKMRSDSDIIWTYFHRHPKTHRWTVKQHARKAFFEFMAGWSIYVRDPRRYGWRQNHPNIPAPTVHVHRIKPTAEQLAIVQKLSRDRAGQLSLFQTADTNTIQRGRLSQIAKGFRYVKRGKSERHVERIPSEKPAFIADLVREEVGAGLQVLVWTVFDAESTIIAELLKARGVSFEVLVGATKKDERLAILDRFRRGELPVLVSRASMLGYGMNFQCCKSMIFSGWNDSYKAYYQALRRAYRFGQTDSLRVHLPVIDELERDMLDNIHSKESRHEADITEMEINYIAAYGRITKGVN